MGPLPRLDVGGGNAVEVEGVHADITGEDEGVAGGTAHARGGGVGDVGEGRGGGEGGGEGRRGGRGNGGMEVKRRGEEHVG